MAEAQPVIIEHGGNIIFCVTDTEEYTLPTVDTKRNGTTTTECGMDIPSKSLVRIGEFYSGKFLGRNLGRTAILYFDADEGLPKGCTSPPEAENKKALQPQGAYTGTRRAVYEVRQSGEEKQPVAEPDSKGPTEQKDPPHHSMLTIESLRYAVNGGKIDPKVRIWLIHVLQNYYDGGYTEVNIDNDKIAIRDRNQVIATPKKQGFTRDHVRGIIPEYKSPAGNTVSGFLKNTIGAANKVARKCILDAKQKLLD